MLLKVCVTVKRGATIRAANGSPSAPAALLSAQSSPCKESLALATSVVPFFSSASFHSVPSCYRVVIKFGRWIVRRIALPVVPNLVLPAYSMPLQAALDLDSHAAIAKVVIQPTAKVRIAFHVFIVVAIKNRITLTPGTFPACCPSRLLAHC